MDFKIFDETYESFLKNDTNPQDNNNITECEHLNASLENSQKICINCGMLLTKDLTFEKEWRFYGLNDTKQHNDPSR